MAHFHQTGSFEVSAVVNDVWPISAKLGHLYRVKLSVVMNDVWPISAKLAHLYRVKLLV